MAGFVEPQQHDTARARAVKPSRSLVFVVSRPPRIFCWRILLVLNSSPSLDRLSPIREKGTLLMLKSATFAAVVLFVAIAPVRAQLSRGSLTGVVTDSTAAVIPNAKVTVTNPNTGASWQTFTNANGQYSVPNLPPGPYELTFEAASFKKLVRSGIELGATEVLRVDATLEVGAVTDSVQITAESPRLQTETPE